MRDEQFCRRSGFRPGRALRLADGQFWSFPAPIEREQIGPPVFSPTYEALLRAWLEAEDGPERRRAELALAIALLDANYCLESSDFTALLESAPGSPDAISLQEGLAGIAWEHIRVFLKAIGPSGAYQKRRDWGLLVRPWKWFGEHWHLPHSPVANRRHPSSRTASRLLARESEYCGEP